MFAQRPYQTAAVENVVAMTGDGIDPVVSLPTGTGKTVVIAGAATAMEPRGRQLFVAHRSELLDQIQKSLVRAGVPAAAIGREEADLYADSGYNRPPFVLAMIQSLNSKRRYEAFAPKGFAAIHTDEGHHGGAAMYQLVYQHFAQNKACRRVGYSATWVDAKGKGTGLSCGYTGVAARMSVGDAIKNGWLVPPAVVHMNPTGIDWDMARLNAVGEYQPGWLDEVLAAEKPLHQLTLCILEQARRLPTVVFGPGVNWVKAAYRVLDRPDYFPGDVRMVLGNERNKAARRGLFDDFRAGRFTRLVNCGVATEGTDLPNAACVAICRPCQSDVLAMQIIGRVLRPLDGVIDDPRRRAELWGDDPRPRLAAIKASDKPRAVVLDFAAVGARKLVTTLDLLGHDLPKPVVDYATRLAQQAAAAAEAEDETPEPQDAFELLKRAQAEWALIQEEIERRRHVTASGVQYECGEVDVFDVRSQTAGGASDVIEEKASPKQVAMIVGRLGWNPERVKAMSRRQASGVIAKINAGTLKPKQRETADAEF